MTSKELLQYLQYAVDLGFVLLGVAATVDWLRHRGARRGYLAAALGLLGLTDLINLVSAPLGNPIALRVLSTAAFVGSGMALLLFRDAFVPLSRGARAVAVAANGVAVAAGLWLILSVPATAKTIALPQWIAIWIFVGVWMLDVGEPAARFWLWSRGSPAVQRARLRALSLGYGGIVAILLVALAGVALVQASSFPFWLALTFDIAALALVPVLYVSFAPPSWLRRTWRESEEQQLQGAMHDLLLFAENQAQLAQRGLGWAMRLLGAEVGYVRDATGNVLAHSGLADEEVEALMARCDPALGLRTVPLEDSRGGNAVVAPLILRGGIGGLTVVSGAFTPIFGTDEVNRLGEYAATLSVSIDRSSLTEDLARQTVRYERLLQAMSDMGEGFLITDGKRPVYANDAYCRLTDYTLDELLKMTSMEALTPPEFHELLTDQAPQRLAGASVPDSYEAALLTKDGRRVAIEVALKVLDFDDQAPQIIAIVRDISERQKAAKELEARASELSRSNAALEEFAYVASHDLQEPLRMVSSYLGLISDRYQGRLDSEADEFIGFAVDGASRMQALIKDLLTYSRVGRMGNVTLVDAGAAFDSAMQNLRSTIEETGAEVTSDKLPRLRADRRELVQLFQNLVSNALKFRAKEPPKIHLSVVADGEMWRFALKDNGIGIAPAHQARIFQIFQRLHQRDAYPGTGIGLSICKKIVERLGGRIWVESEGEGGSTFLFTLQKTSHSDDIPEGSEDDNAASGKPRRRVTDPARQPISAG